MLWSNLLLGPEGRWRAALQEYLDGLDKTCASNVVRRLANVYRSIILEPRRCSNLLMQSSVEAPVHTVDFHALQAQCVGFGGGCIVSRRTVTACHVLSCSASDCNGPLRACRQRYWTVLEVPQGLDCPRLRITVPQGLYLLIFAAGAHPVQP